MAYIEDSTITRPLFDREFGNDLGISDQGFLEIWQKQKCIGNQTAENR